MEKDNITFTHLLANPYHYKKRTQQIINKDIDYHILNLFHKKFPNVRIEKEEYYQIIIKIEKILIETRIQKIIDQVIDQVIDEQ